MRLFALTALLGSVIACTTMSGQSLADHAAAASGATIGTAAGKPIGTSMTKIFGGVDKTTSKAANPKAAKPIVPPAEAKERAEPPLVPAVPGGDAAIEPGGARTAPHRSARRRQFDAVPESSIAAPVATINAAPSVREPSLQEVASIQVGVTGSELNAKLGQPESRVTIPGDDGHLLEICQYWSNGQAIGTIRLDNGRVVSVQARN